MNSTPTTCPTCARTLGTVEVGLDTLGRCLECSAPDFAHVPPLSWDKVLAALAA